MSCCVAWPYLWVLYPLSKLSCSVGPYLVLASQVYILKEDKPGKKRKENWNKLCWQFLKYLKAVFGFFSGRSTLRPVSIWRDVFLLLTTPAQCQVQVASASSLHSLVSRQQRPWKPFLRLFPGWQKAAFCSMIWWKVKRVNMSGQHRTELLFYLLGSAYNFLNCFFAPPTAGFLPLNFIGNEYLQLGIPAAWRVHEHLQNVVRSMYVNHCVMFSDCIWLQLCWFNYWLQVLLLCSLSPFLQFARFCTVWWSSGAAVSAGLSWSVTWSYSCDVKPQIWHPLS